MSRTHRQVPYSPAAMRHPHTFNEIKQLSAVEQEEYPVSSRNRKPPTAWDDIVATSAYQEDHHK
jgi:hypothetical protein